MKSFSRAIIVALAVVGITVAAAPAWAELIAYDPFGTSGDLNGTTTGSGFSAGWTAPTYYKLVTSSLPRPANALAAGGGSAYNFKGTSGPVVAYRPLSTLTPLESGTDNTWFVSFSYRVGSGSLPTAQYGLGGEPAFTNRIAAASDMLSGSPTELLLFYDGATATLDWGAAMDRTTSYLYVMKVVTHSNNTIDMYLNTYSPTETVPTSAPTTWEMSLTATTPANVTYGYAVFSGVARASSGTSQAVDEYRIGTTWQDVAAIPEPSTLALLATGLVGLLCYAWRKRK